MPMLRISTSPSSSSIIIISSRTITKSLLQRRAITIKKESVVCNRKNNINKIYSSTLTVTSTTPRTIGTYEGITTTSSPWKTLLLCTAGGLLITTVGTLKYIHSQVNVGNGDGDTEGLQRSLSFYSLAIPLYAQYRLLQMHQAPQEEWDALDKYASTVGLDKILDLRGFYIKAGQMAASNIGNAFPKIWQNTMSVLQDDCPYKSFEEVRAIVEADLNLKVLKKVKLEDVFVEFERRPIGAASIGQVHRAKLRGTNESVVVKVQYPEVEGLFRGDVRTMIMFCKVAQPVHVPALEEIEVQFMTEFDYRKEALQLQTVRENMVRAGLCFVNDNGNADTVCCNKERAFNKSKSCCSAPSQFMGVCEVPRPYMDLCSKNVLVMEYLDGQKLADGLQQDLERHAIRNGQTLEDFRADQEQKDREARVAKIELMGPSAQEMDHYIALLDGQRRLKNLKAMLNNLFSWRRRPREEYEGKHTLPLNHARLVDELLYIHGHQILVDGYFNGDPHPGNILLLNGDDKRAKTFSWLFNLLSGCSGSPYRLGLIDYGQVKKITKSDRITMCKLVIAMAEENHDEVVRLMKETGYSSKNMDPDIMYKYYQVSFDEDNMKVTNGMHIQEFMEYLDGADPVESLARDYIMISRVTILLRGLAHALHQSRSVAKAWKPIAERVLREEGLTK